MRDKSPNGWPFQTQKLLISWGPGSSLLEAAHSQCPAPQADHRSPPTVNSLCLSRQRTKAGGLPDWEKLARGMEALTPGIVYLWQTTMAEGLTLSQPKVKTSYLGASREAGWGYCFSFHYRQVAGMSSPPLRLPPTTAEGPGLGGGWCRMQQKEASPMVPVSEAEGYS